MGRPRVKIIDDAQEEAEKKASRKIKKAKSETDKASGEVERTTEFNESSQEHGAKQTPSESLGETSGALQSDEPTSGAADRSNKPDERANQKKPQKPGKTKPRSKKYQELTKDLDRTKTYSLTEAVDMAKKLSYAKFNATLETHINTSQTGIRGLVSLPYAKGRKLRILIFGRLPEPSEYEGIVFGDDSTIESIAEGKVDFDLLITTPEWMPKLAGVAKILGPRGLMPNPKNGTIISGEAGLKKAVEGFQAGKTEYEHSSKQVYKTESKAPVMHIALGKLDQPTEELVANLKTLLQTLGKSRVKKVSLSPTMGPSVKLNLASL